MPCDLDWVENGLWDWGSIKTIGFILNLRIKTKTHSEKKGKYYFPYIAS